MKNILLIIIAIVAIRIMFSSNNIKTDIEAYNHKIDSIQLKIDSIQVVNAELGTQIALIDGEINKVDSKILTVNKTITNIQNETHTKVESVNNYSIHDLNKFFSDRYDSTSKGYDSSFKSTDSKIDN